MYLELHIGKKEPKKRAIGHRPADFHKRQQRVSSLVYGCRTDTQDFYIVLFTIEAAGTFQHDIACASREGEMGMKIN